jgi:hypothetical protein
MRPYYCPIPVEEDMTEQKNPKEPLNWARVGFSIFYFALGVLLIVLFRRDMFHLKVEEGWWNGYGFAWCVSGVCIGFSSVAFSLRRHGSSPFPRYVTDYPVQLIAMAALVFAGLHIFDATSGYLFYYLSFGLCLRYSRFPDQILNSLR